MVHSNKLFVRKNLNGKTIRRKPNIIVNNKVGSSETIRGILYYYMDIYSLEKIDINFLKWFIGFTEGDGCFSFHQKTGYLTFKITQSSNDAQILFYIKKTLGFGSVSVQDKLNKTHQFRVRDKKGLATLIYIFNGNLLLEKRQLQFSTWLNAFNVCYKTSIIMKENRVKFSLNNAWLSGFTDAEGYFTASIIKRSKNYTQVKVRYILSQQGEFKLLNNIKIVLNGTICYLKSYNRYNMTVNLSKLSKIIHYFSVYPLKTKKKIHYLNWIKIYNLIISKQHFNPINLPKIQNLINKLNK